MKKISEKAFCKINLGLEVIEKRSDGYHNINTIFQKINLYDEIEITDSKELIVDCEPSLNIPQEENICYKAYNKLQKYFNISDFAKIRIKKLIPSGAGLGGGSSDAATVLSLVQKYYNLDDDKIIFQIAKELGADVPYFLKHGTAQAKGIGDELEYFNLEVPYHILLINPGININTQWAYNEMKIQKSKPCSDLKSIVLENINNPAVLKRELVNDFEDVVFKYYPIIGEIKINLYNQGAQFALMSGSGSTMFAFFDNKLAAGKASDYFNKYFCFIGKAV